MYRFASSLASKARIARNGAQLIGSRVNWSRNYAAKDIRFGVEARDVRVTMGPKATGWVHLTGTRYSSTVPSDPDTHEDFHPSNKTENSKASLKDIVEQDVRDNPVMVYMKGVPDSPQCGFSALAIRVLRHYEVPLSARNIFENPELKDAVKSFSNWPTFPQVFIKGEFIGGSDIVLNLHQNGELKEMLKDLAANKKSE